MKSSGLFLDIKIHAINESMIAYCMTIDFELHYVFLFT